MFTKIHVRNFKSLVDVNLNLSSFNCLVGMNGAGKSTLLQVIDFISRQMHGDLEGWLENRSWESKDLYSKTGDKQAAKKAILLGVDYTLENGDCLKWRASFNRTSMRITREQIMHVDKKKIIFEVNEGKCRVGDSHFPIAFDYSGSVLSQLKDSYLTAEIKTFRDAVRNIKSLELLSPQSLRKRSRLADTDIGPGGEKLSGFLSTLTPDARSLLLDELRRFYPEVNEFRIATSKGGWKRLLISESHLTEDHEQAINEIDASQLNDGLLRILAVLAQNTASGTSMLLLDEVENGVNPEIIEKLVDTLVASPMQVIVTTHSPMVLNYLDDNIAEKSVQLVYKSESAQTRVRPFFGIEYTREKLSYMGPGEALIDTDHYRLRDEFLKMDKLQEKKNIKETNRVPRA
ncbi:ATP-binding protein [Citrobacter farmeri]|uniref:AAA family ATPase n=1 Tax=Citrobacter farmeri TaxID=67824 RepID=UPI002A81CBCD|nr:ATP-binding protein [Citrobacter farmeri]